MGCDFHKVRISPQLQQSSDHQIRSSAMKRLEGKKYTKLNSIVVQASQYGRQSLLPILLRHGHIRSLGKEPIFSSPQRMPLSSKMPTMSSTAWEFSLKQTTRASYLAKSLQSLDSNAHSQLQRQDRRIHWRGKQTRTSSHKREMVNWHMNLWTAILQSPWHKRRIERRFRLSHISVLQEARRFCRGDTSIQNDRQRARLAVNFPQCEAFSFGRECFMTAREWLQYH